MQKVLILLCQCKSVRIYWQLFYNIWNFYRDKVNDFANENENTEAIDFRINDDRTTTSKCFEYMTKLIGSTPNNGGRLNAEIVVTLKYLSNFWS